MDIVELSNQNMEYLHILNDNYDFYKKDKAFRKLMNTILIEADKGFTSEYYRADEEFRTK